MRRLRIDLGLRRLERRANLAPARMKWMIENGSDVHRGGDGPLMRAALKGNRIPMMELLVRRLSPGSAVILMTAHGTPEVTTGALDLGAFQVVHKPFDMHELRSVLDQAGR